MTEYLEGGRSRHHVPARLERDPNILALPDGDRVLRGGCAGCGYNLNGFIRESWIADCPTCGASLCPACREAPCAAGHPCAGCARHPVETDAEVAA